METSQTIIDKLKTLGETEAVKLIKENATLIQNNPDLQKQIANTYMQAFGPVPGSTQTGAAPTTPVPTVTPPPVPGNTIDTSTGLPYVAPDEKKNPWAEGGFTYGTQTFTPDGASKLGVFYNSKGTNDEEKYGITYTQKNDFIKYIQNLRKLGLPESDVTKRSSDYLKQFQADNKNSNTYGKSYGSDPGKVPTDPTQAKGTVGSLVDLDGNGIPDAQEGFGLEDKNKPTEFTKLNTNPWGKEYTFDTTDFSGLEKSFMDYSRDALTYETNQRNKAAASYEAVTNENARRVIDTNNTMIGSIQGLLEERINQNKEQYKDAVGGVYRQFGGQVKQFQRLIGSDGKAVDDATALALMGDTGVGAMSKIVDLKNQLVNQYLAQKDQAIKDIYKLQKENAITAGEAASAVTAIRDQAELDVIDMTKTFYKDMFGMTEKVDQRTEETQNAIRSGVSTYLAALGLTPIQQNQMLNNYIKEGYSVNDALTQLSDDIRNQRGPVLQYIDQNNQAAADAARAAFEQKLALEIKPIIAKGEVDLALLNDKQKFEAEQNALDRKVKIAGSTVSKGSKELSYTQKVAMADALSKYGEGTFPTSLSEGQALEIISAASTLDKDKNNKAAQAALDKYGMTLSSPSGFVESLRSTSA